MKKKQLRDVFIPFHEVSDGVYSSIIAMWLFIFGFLWWKAPELIPTPLEALSQLITFIKDPDFYLEVLASVILTFTGMLASIIFACIISYLSVISFFKPLAYFIVKVRYMSLAGFMYIFTLILHNAGNVKIALLMLGIVPFFTLNLLNVFDKIEQKEYDLWTTLRYNKWEQLWHVLIVGKLDLTIEAIRSNLAIAWMMIIMIETYSMANGGLGVLLYKAAGKTQVDKVLALQFCIFILGMSFDYMLKQLRLKAFPHIALAEKG